MYVLPSLSFAIIAIPTMLGTLVQTELTYTAADLSESNGNHLQKPAQLSHNHLSLMPYYTYHQGLLHNYQKQTGHSSNPGQDRPKGPDQQQKHQQELKQQQSSPYSIDWMAGLGQKALPHQLMFNPQVQPQQQQQMLLQNVPAAAASGLAQYHLPVAPQLPLSM